MIERVCFLSQKNHPIEYFCADRSFFNSLLDVGPMEDGTFTPEQTKILKDLGRWTKKHQEAIYATRRGILCGHFYGPTTLSKDRKTLYCFVLDIPKDNLFLEIIFISLIRC
jgi:hypothetical protein